MASCKLPSLVGLDGLRLSRAGSNSCFASPSSNVWKRRASRRPEHARLAMRCSLERPSETSSVQTTSNAEFGPSSGALEFREQGNVEASLRREQKNAASSSGNAFTLFSVAPMLIVPAIAEGAGYSQASYYTSLGLFVISVPGVWSLVKRSTKSKVQIRFTGLEPFTF